MAYKSHSNLSEVNDVELMFTGDRFPVIVGPSLRASGWRGGLFVRYVTGLDDFTVEVSDGNEAAGFLLFQSENYGPSQPGSFSVSPSSLVGSSGNFIGADHRSGVGGHNVVTMVEGGTRAFFKAFETTSISGGVRTGGAASYTLNEALKISENGLLCNDSDGELTAIGITDIQTVGIVSAIPSTGNGGRLCIDYKY